MQCETTHLTSFSVLVDRRGSMSSATTVESVSSSVVLHRVTMYVHVLVSLYCQLHWLWYINIVFDSNATCNSILEVCMYICLYICMYIEFKLYMYVTNASCVYIIH